MNRAITLTGFGRDSLANFDIIDITPTIRQHDIFAIKDIFAIFNISNINARKIMIAI